MKKIKIALQKDGKIEFTIEADVLPKIGEYITIVEEDKCKHYKVQFIEHNYNVDGEFLQYLVTAIGL
jgi:hypothetical protein